MSSLLVPERSTLVRYTMGVGLFIVAAFLGIAMWQGSEPPDSSISNASPVFMQGSAQVLADRPVVLMNPQRDIVMNIPCCSLGIGGTISMVEREPDLFAQSYWLEEWSRPKVIQVEFTNTQGEVVPNAYSSTAVELCFVLNDQQWEQYQLNPTGYQIQYYDNIYRPYEWRRISSYETGEGNSICAETSRLGLFTLATTDKGLPITGENGLYSP